MADGESSERYQREHAFTDRANWLRRGGALFLRYLANRLDSVDIVQKHLDSLVGIHSLIVKLPQLLAASLAPSTGTVVVLWAGGADGAGFVSRTFDLPNDSKRDAQIEVYRPIPEGAWVVAHDCIFTAVHVGDHAHDLGPIPRGKLVRLTHRVEPGDRLHLQLMRDNGHRGSQSGRYAG